MIDLWEGAGWFIWPLGLCSMVSLFIVIERLLALRAGRIFPTAIRRGLQQGGKVPAGEGSAVSRLITFYNRDPEDKAGLRALVQLEVTHMQQGLSLLDSIVGVAPLLGLLGTVWGLIKVFNAIDIETGLPDTAFFVEGIAMALTTTMLGLIIAIIALVGVNALRRRVEAWRAHLYFAIERLGPGSSRHRQSEGSAPMVESPR